MTRDLPTTNSISPALFSLRDPAVVVDRVRRRFDPELSMVIDRAHVAVESAPDERARLLALALLRALERFIPRRRVRRWIDG